MNEIIISQIRQRLEILYQMVDELERSGGGGEPGTTNYNDLSNKPSVNGHTLIGAKTSSDLDLQPVISDLSTIRSGAALGATAVQPAIMNDALADKQDTLTFDTTPTNGSSNPVKSSGVYTALDNKVDKVNGKGLSTNDFTDSDKAQITTNKNGIAALANSGSKNQLDVSQTPSTMNAGNITITKGADGSLTLNGTSTVVSDVIIGRITLPAGDYVLSGCAEGGSGGTWLIRIYGEPNITNASHTAGTVFHTDGITNADVRIVVGSNKTLTNAVFKPMICTKAEWDISQEFVLYAPTNRKLYEDKADKTEVATIVNRGSKNLLKIFATTQTVNGITFTVNADDTVTISGTATAAATLTLATASQINSFLPLGTYKLSGCTGGSTTTYDLRFFHPGDNSTVLNHNGDTQFTRNATKTDSNISILVRSGQVMDNVVIKPMIRDASIEDDTYQPYAPTNRELYEMILSLQ